MSSEVARPPAGAPAGKMIKCVVWDLDHTLWDGVLLEDDEVRLRPGIAEVLRVLDERGVLHSVASRNDPDAALAALRRLGVAEYFLHPQIGWGAKSTSVRAVADALNIGLDALAFVDDDDFERAEVGHALPEVRCIDAAEAATLADRPELTPEVVTEDARQRRDLYRADLVRQQVESRFDGPTEEFLATLRMHLTIAEAGPDDLLRAEELTVRTHQLNTTGYTYSRAQLDAFRTSPRHRLYVARLSDRYGPYGTIGLTLVEQDSRVWTIKLLLMSCRVMSRGVGAVVITFLRRLARDAGVRLVAEFVPNGRNRMMHVTYRMNRFREIGRDGDRVRLECDLTDVPPLPGHLRVETP
ncbi:HAD-IIIC family phosphatase [Micromonospora chaiyaphumensis]|uniref:HAD-superfamily phosphatase, subfamily IIIC/FkbH-like domain-containing protein n=1 Tax=Micromonospora chaiyaphumensis TaxID=307119 RepID=A0A1C4VZY5_9ACTN|nr:HAD-IIIC family phosphatase [Micromonospora chaiyaphumensis]SCE89527.1 HAD-superfamily phosphatase, subfamily IIIC/FkbH-like domain-containing protein [Micromonospora chaiyaphumensis]